MQYLLVEHPLPLWSFFTGLIVASVVYLMRQNPLHSTYEKLIFFVGIGIAYGISIAPPVVLEGTVVTMFLAGSIALCAMILPGISGSFILVLLGLYPVFIGAIANLQIDILTAFALGGIIGLMLFSRLLSWLLARFETLVIATMCGFLIGSLSIIWPWKLVTSSITTDSGKVLVLSTDNLMPSEFLGLTGGDPQTFLCTVMFVFALSAVMGLDYFAKSKLESTQ
jgi:putative membrane protein